MHYRKNSKVTCEIWCERCGTRLLRIVVTPRKLRVLKEFRAYLFREPHNCNGAWRIK